MGITLIDSMYNYDVPPLYQLPLDLMDDTVTVVSWKILGGAGPGGV